MRLTTIKAGLACGECCLVAWGGERWYTGKLGVVCVSCRDGEFEKVIEGDKRARKDDHNQG